MTAKEKIAAIVGALSEYTKQELAATFGKVAIKIWTEYPDKLKEWGIPNSVKNVNLSKKTFNKTELTSLCSILFFSKESFSFFEEQIDQKTKTLFKILTFEGALHQDTIENQLGIEVYRTDPKRFYSYRVFVKPEFQFFKHNYTSWEQNELVIYLPIELRKILKDYYTKPEGAELKPQKELPETDFLYENAESIIAAELNRLLIYHSKGEIAVTMKKRPKFTTLTKMKKSLALQEFFPGEKDRKLKTLRTQILAGLISLLPQKQSMSDNVAAFIKKVLFHHYYIKEFASPGVLLNDLKGMGTIDNVEFYDCESSIYEIIRQLPVNEWVSVERIINFAHFNIIPLRPIRSFQAQDKLHYDVLDESLPYRDYTYIHYGLYDKAITVPFLKGSFFLLAAFGLCEIAYNRPDRTEVGRTCYSAYDELKFVRLTELGAYVADQIKAYTIKKKPQETSITLSPDALTITIGEEDSGAAYLLEPYTQRVGPNRFTVDNSLFLKNCRTKKDLENKILLFKETIGLDFPPNWEAFFQEMLQKIEPFDTPDEMLLYKIPESNKALIKLIAQDKELKKLILKAEDYHILIPKKKFSAFKNRLSTFGYLIS